MKMVELDQTSTPQYRLCSKCRQYKLLNEYQKDKTRLYGVGYVCKSCEKERQRIYNTSLHGKMIRERWKKSPIGILSHYRCISKPEFKQRQRELRYAKVANGEEARQARKNYHALQRKYGYYTRVVEWYPLARQMEALMTAPIVEIEA